MSSGTSEFNAQIRETFNLLSQEQQWQDLVKNPSRITEDLLESLEVISSEVRKMGNLEAAESIFLHGTEAAELIDNSYYLIRFLEGIAEIAEEKGQTERAVEMRIDACNQLNKLIDSGEIRAIGKLVQVSLHIARLEMQHNNPEAAQQFLVKTRRRCHELGSISGELWTNLYLTNICFDQKDLRLARDYATSMSQLYIHLRKDATYEPELPDITAVYGALINVARAYYYDQEDFEVAASLASQAINLLPQQWVGYFLLGTSQMQLNQYEAAVKTWESAIEQDPKQAAPYMNYATSLEQVGRFEDAIEAVDKAILLSSENAKYYLLRGRINQKLNRHEAAIADFTRILLLNEQRPKVSESSSHPPRTQIEYQRNMPLHDLADIARIDRARSYQASNQIEKATADLDYLIQRGDAPTKCAAYFAQGELYESIGRYPEAIELYSSAIRSFPFLDAHKNRADAYLHQGQFDEAVRDSALIAHLDPESALEHLNKILAVMPDHPLALKWRGFAYRKVIRPSKAEEDLNRAIEFLPRDAEIYLWRGLARIMTSFLPEEKAWSDSLNFTRIKGAIEDLGSALYLSPDNSEALASFKWLVDRVCFGQIMKWLIENGRRENGIFNVIPNAREPFERLQHGLELARRRQWSDAIQELNTCQGVLLQIGFPVLSKRIHMHMADIFLRLNELHLAIDHLTEAEKMWLVISQPLTPRAISDTEDVRQNSWLKSGRVGIVIELEYLGICSVAFNSSYQELNLLKAEAYIRVGNMTEALSLLRATVDFDDDKLEWSENMGFDVLILIAIILRKAEDYKHALKVMEKLKDRDLETNEVIILLNTLGTVHLASGDHTSALQCFQEVLTIIAREQSENFTREYLIGTKLNIASSYFYNQQFQEALSVLVSPEIAQVGLKKRDRFEYLALLTRILFITGHPLEAQKAALEAITIADNMRGEFKLIDIRVSWQTTQQEIYIVGILISLANMDFNTSLELVERSKARTFVDLLETGYLPLPSSTKQLQEIENNLQQKKVILLMLANSIKLRGRSFVDYELVKELEKIDKDVNITEQIDEALSLSSSKIADHLTKIDESLLRIHRQIEESRLLSVNIKSGRTLTLKELRQLLVT